MAEFGIIDLFAGPGGLGEGFSSFQSSDGRNPFEIVLSAEKEASAHATLCLRAFLRQFGDQLPDEYLDYHAGLRDRPDWSSLYPEQWQKAEQEARQLELGTVEATEALDQAIECARTRFGNNTVVIGGPPCQAYSLVGRARNRGIEGYKAEDDPRHFLFREYIRVLDRLRPAAFVMENVKGLLSSKVNEERVLDMLMLDLSSLGGERDLYRILPLDCSTPSGLPGLHRFDPADFIVRSENFGVPQARHRVILVGIRRDIVEQAEPSLPLLHRKTPQQTVLDVISTLPELRSGLSREADDTSSWREAVASEMDRVAEALRLKDASLARKAKSCRRALLERNASLSRQDNTYAAAPSKCSAGLSEWLTNSSLRGTANHESRGHMRPDLGRYFFAALFAQEYGRSPKAEEYPDALAPEHANWKSGKFADRFRVQVADKPSSTIVSHISKDGHYFIHPDPMQCRSLTVREAGRLQTFPDDYYFEGNRTQQFVQVGNAVPPFLAVQIAGVVYKLLRASQTAVSAKFAEAVDC